MSVNCVYCGHVNPDGSTVCLSCGRTLPPAPSAGGGSYGQQPPQSWGNQPGGGQPPSSYPPQNPYGGSYPPQQQPGSFGTPPPAAQPPSYGNQPSSFGNPSYPPQQPQTPSYGQQQTPPVWGATPQQQYGAPGGNDAAKSAKQLAMIGMIVGIVGAVFGWCCYSGFLLGPAALIIGFLGKSKLTSANSQDGNGMAMAAIGLGVLAFIEPFILIVIGLLLGGLGAIGGH